MVLFFVSTASWLDGSRETVFWMYGEDCSRWIPLACKTIWFSKPPLAARHFGMAVSMIKSAFLVQKYFQTYSKYYINFIPWKEFNLNFVSPNDWIELINITFFSFFPYLDFFGADYRPQWNFWNLLLRGHFVFLFELPIYHGEIYLTQNWQRGRIFFREEKCFNFCPWDLTVFYYPLCSCTSLECLHWLGTPSAWQRMICQASNS